MAAVSFEGIGKIYTDGTRAVSDLRLEITDGEFMVLVGPSGCGKTTALRMVAGLAEISEGVVRIGDRVVNNVASRDRDNAMVLINSGDELTLRFPAGRLPAKPPGQVRDFFLYSVGWDKDADFHTKLGSVVEPLPWNGMDDQRYGEELRPAFENDNWIRKYNTRWVGPRMLTRSTARNKASAHGSGSSREMP